MIDLAWARQFAAEWIEAWNAHDLDRILAHYSDDFEMTSPLIIQRMNEPSGTLKGKAAIRPYWQIGLSAVPPLKFELIDVFVGVDSITLYYRRASGQLSAEVLIFNHDGLVIKGIAHYGE
jgi:ketosteroid isomerase-like protein